LQENPDPVVRFRLLRDVLQRPPNSTEMVQARVDLAKSRWIQQLADEQWPDGSWGRLHSQDSNARQWILTTEVGVERALALGLEADHPILRKTAQYLTSILEGTVQYRDPPEKNNRWPTGVRLFAAATLAQIQPDLPVLDEGWDLWATIACRTFSSGEYDPRAEILAHRELTGIRGELRYLILNNKYSLALLGSRATALASEVESTLLDWIWHHRDGIGYLGQPMYLSPAVGKSPGHLDAWFRSLELLAKFPSWRDLAGETMQWFWNEQKPAGGWDFGRIPAFSMVLPLSESWRRKGARQFDWTTRVLVLLRCYYTSGEAWSQSSVGS
jgi:hypothetical protein